MKPRIGRPLKAPATKRVALGLKVTAVIKRRIDKSAVANGRTQSQEAEHRIELSYSYERSVGRIKTLQDHVAGIEDKLYYLSEDIAQFRTAMEKLLEKIEHNAWIAAENSLKQKSSDIPAPVPDSCSLPSPH